MTYAHRYDGHTSGRFIKAVAEPSRPDDLDGPKEKKSNSRRTAPGLSEKKINKIMRLRK